MIISRHKTKGNCLRRCILSKSTQFIYLEYSFLRAKDFQQLNNGRKIVGIVIKICALLQIFLSIHENHELLITRDKIWDNLLQYSDQNQSDKSLCVNLVLSIFYAFQDFRLGLKTPTRLVRVQNVQH